jgi:hypothetical protein
MRRETRHRHRPRRLTPALAERVPGLMFDAAVWRTISGPSRLPPPAFPEQARSWGRADLDDLGSGSVVGDAIPDAVA